MINEYPGDSLSQMLSEAYLKVYLCRNDIYGVERTLRRVVRVTQH